MLLIAPLIKQLFVSGCGWNEKLWRATFNLKHSATEQLHFKDESGICWDDGWESSSAIRIVRRAGQPGNLAKAHL